MPKVVSPLKGAPRTKEKRDASNKSTFNITCDVLTPERAMVVDWLLQAVALLLLLAIVVTCNDAGWPVAMVIRLSLFAGLVYLAASYALRDLLSKQTFIKMNEDYVYTYPYYILTKAYDRKKEHTFTVIQHDKALDESRRHEKAVAEASMRGRLLRKKPYYQDSWHIVYVNGHTRVDLCTVYGAKEASAILNRLMFCDRVLNQQLGIGGGFSRDADDQYARDAGDL